MTRSEKEIFMKAALGEARKGWGRTHPQPMIGAVLVENGEIVAREHVSQSGSRGPESRLFGSLGRKPVGDASLFLTL
jgi:diaminohydroxyphosphoribosylaminopyrimidine deaminase/5-amino-6-(5-phosphoribosylamino)uracil reductase